MYDSLHDDDAPFCGCLAVNVIHTSASTSNDFEICTRFDHISRHFGGRSHYETIIFLSKKCVIITTVWLIYPVHINVMQIQMLYQVRNTETE